MLLQEEDEQSYKQQFPDHFSTFDDVAELDDMPDLGDDSTASAAAAAAEADAEGLTEAEASSSAAQQLLQGEILSDVVSLHARYALLHAASFQQTSNAVPERKAVQSCIAVHCSL